MSMAHVASAGQPQHCEVMLHPGECFVGDQNCRVETLLGSCVSVTLWHPYLKVGAMSHFLLASRDVLHINRLDGRYGDEAIMLMLVKMASRHVVPRECEAKIFGGGDMFPGRRRTAAMCVGRRNGEVARRLLRSLHIPVVSENLFGAGHRKIIFDIETGTVWTRKHGLEADARHPTMLHD